MNPKYPIYIVSKGRWESRKTARALEAMGVPYRIIVEEQEREKYAAVIDSKRVLVLPKRYQEEYDTCDDLGAKKSKGPGAARNYAWEHAVEAGAKWHWVMDDNIWGFYRLSANIKMPVGDGTILRCMEDFCLRYSNVAMAGPNYFMFAKARTKWPPFWINTRIYSCNLIRNDLPYRWRGRYNEDTDLSLRMLKDGWCTILFQAFLQGKTPTQQARGGGNTDDFYRVEGTLPKSAMQVQLHPDVSRMMWRFGRVHHFVDYRPFRKNKLKLRRGVKIKQGEDNYGMKLTGRGT